MIGKLFSLLFAPAAVGAVAAGVFWIYAPKEFDRTWWEVRRLWHEATHDRTLNLNGLRRLSQEDLEVRLPLHESNLWWILNGDRVEAALLPHPLVRGATLTRCTPYAFNCFNLAVQERQARYVVEVDGKRWVVGDDSAFMAPAPAGEQLADTILITGISQKGSSPDVVRARIEMLRGGIDMIEGTAKLPIREVRMLPAEEFEVSFSDFDVAIRFDLSQSGATLDQQCARFARLLKEFEGRLQLIKSIDLSYDKMAVVKLSEAAAPTPPPR